MAITALLIDDEPKSSAILTSKLERFCPQIKIIGTEQNPVLAIELILELKPQLVFLDIAMPQMNGFEVLAKIPEPHFEIIFITAFDNYAIDAIKHCAIGYIVKPVDNEELIVAVNNAMKNIEAKSALQKNQLLVENLNQTHKKKIVVPTQSGMEFIRIEDILYCEGIKGYTKINLVNKASLLSSQSIGNFNKMLERHEFYLIHKSFLVNLNAVESYLNEGYLILINKEKIPVSRNRKTELLSVLKMD
ncbi:response regulator transcription factor [Taibaiella lutea]|uniref:Response regulator transcription factor n=1 Tax=Taibaiella lutea TaxID=2608001 RepID=A0A5M6CGZ8_9BACT|nr:LytTR family DNA-binding domain-containing protein [Taibaiella lutea]KAA5533700.1 response regulator transcription factor [Taibaiella lutea]